MRKLVHDPRAGFVGLASGMMFCLAAIAHGQQATDATAIGPQQAQQLDRARGIDTGPGERLQAVPGADVQPDILTPRGAPGEDRAIGQPLDQRALEQQTLERQRAWDQRAIDDPALPPPMEQPRWEERELMPGERGELGVFLDPSPGPGVRISGVVEGSAAAEAGLVTGDVILQFNGRGVTTPGELSQLVRGMPAGEQVTLQVWRDGQTGELTATLRPTAERTEYRVGFAPDDPRMNDDLAMRQQRLEQQLNQVMQELQMLRQEMQQLQAGMRPDAPAAPPAREFDAFELDPLPEVEPPPEEPRPDEIEREPIEPIEPDEPELEEPEAEPDDLDLFN